MEVRRSDMGDYPHTKLKCRLNYLTKTGYQGRCVLERSRRGPFYITAIWESLNGNGNGNGSTTWPPEAACRVLAVGRIPDGELDLVSR